jgi:ABC-type Fe3+-hydroxamate transport system substrate-binding protein
MQRIISLVPSQTELLFDLGLNDEVIGITKFCVHPHEWFKTRTRIGGTKNINIEKIKLLQPDFVIANKEENVKEQIEELEKFTNVYVSDVSNLEDAKKMIAEIGKLVNREAQSKFIVDEIERKFLQIENVNQQKLHAAYLIWNDPYMTIGGDTFINDMMQYCGFKNIFEDQLRYPEISIKQLQQLNCKILLLSSEPYPFKQKHIDELQPLLPNTKIMLVDGEMFSWYGSRLLLATDYFMQLRQAIQEVM